MNPFAGAQRVARARRPAVEGGQHALATPLALRAFRWLISAAFVSNAGVWIWGVMGGYVMAHLTHVPSLVAALPVALALPGVLFALPAGAVADASDRRLVLLTAKALYCAALAGLALLSFSGALTPFALLVFALVLGTANTFSTPAWWATIGQLVPERLLSRALSLDGLQWNLGQVVGPVLGGSLLATIGTAGMFGVAALLVAALVAFLLVWRGRARSRLSSPAEAAAEAMNGAVAAGVRYLANAPALQVVCWRTVLFVLPGCALPALLPLFGARVLGIGSLGYGLLLAAVGTGSVIGAATLPRVYERLQPDTVVGIAALVSAASTVALVLVHERAVAAVALAASGAAWLASVTSLNLTVQQAVPRWVLSRALGSYLMVFQASVVLGGLVWGAIADIIGVQRALLVAAGTLLPGAVILRWLRLPAVESRDLQVVARPQPELLVEPEHDDGPVMIVVDYQIDPDDDEAFIELMEEVRVVRRRTGATRWSLFEDAKRPGHFVESFVTASWGGYLRQRSRYTAADLRMFDKANELHALAEPPTIGYFIHPESVLAYRRRARWRRLRGVDRVLGKVGRE